MDEGLKPVDIARGLFRFSNLCLYPSSRMIDNFLVAAHKTPYRLDGDAIIGHSEHQVGLIDMRTPVKVFEYFC